MSTAEIGKWLGLIIGGAGGAGITLGGFLADRWGRRDMRWYLWIVAVALIVALPFSIAAFLAPSPTLALLLCSVVNIWAALHYYIAGKYLENDLEKV